MSRIGKKAIIIPSNVDAKIDSSKNIVSIKGPKGNLALALGSVIKAKVENNELSLLTESNTLEARALHGLQRSLLANMVEGVVKGYQKKLLINGVGYKAELKGTKLSMALGFSHIIELEQPDGIVFKLENPQTLLISGIDKELVGQIAAKIRGFKPAEPYNGKGVQYSTEKVRRKAGKTGK